MHLQVALHFVLQTASQQVEVNFTFHVLSVCVVYVCVCVCESVV